MWNELEWLFSEKQKCKIAILIIFFRISLNELKQEVICWLLRRARLFATTYFHSSLCKHCAENREKLVGQHVNPTDFKTSVGLPLLLASDYKGSCCFDYRVVSEIKMFVLDTDADALKSAESLNSALINVDCRQTKRLFGLMGNSKFPIKP